MYTITKEFHFSASHTLDRLPKNHKCHNLHGHNYIVIVELQADELDENGFVEDYGKLHTIQALIDRNLDHRHLNDVTDFPYPTAELIAKYLFDLFRAVHPQVSAVTVKETDKTSATYRL